MVLLPLLLLQATNCADDRLTVLAIGQVLPGESPIPQWFDADPLVDYILIPTDIDFMQGATSESGIKTWRRFIRIYFPKTRKDLIENFEFYVFPDGNIDPFTTTQIADIRHSIENGMGSFVTLGGDLAAPSHTAFPGWLNSALYELLPAELNDKMRQSGDEFRIEVVLEDPPVLSAFVPLGIEKVRASIFSLLYPKPGSTIWANMVSPGIPPYAPGVWLVSWKVGSGGGVFWAVADDLDASFWSSLIRPCENPYNMDIFLNIMLYSTGRELPVDILQVHDLRRKYWQFNEEKALMISLFEFVDKFGANTRSLEEEILEADRLKGLSFDEYRHQLYSEALESINRGIEVMLDISNRAIELKDRALFWVYLTEWSAVTGTMLASGFVVYDLLVRRRSYKEVDSTRLILNG
ncbi:MAG: hypothetical protein HXS50_05190 [Theionarchaea archaeon]|nr:hypothetical protein [Theionarchaea archaeon]